MSPSWVYFVGNAPRRLHPVGACVDPRVVHVDAGGPAHVRGVGRVGVGTVLDHQVRQVQDVGDIARGSVEHHDLGGEGLFAVHVAHVDEAVVAEPLLGPLDHQGRVEDALLPDDVTAVSEALLQRGRDVVQIDIDLPEPSRQPGAASVVAHVCDVWILGVDLDEGDVPLIGVGLGVDLSQPRYHPRHEEARVRLGICEQIGAQGRPFEALFEGGVVVAGAHPVGVPHHGRIEPEIVGPAAPHVGAPAGPGRLGHVVDGDEEEVVVARAHGLAVEVGAVPDDGVGSGIEGLTRGEGDEGVDPRRPQGGAADAADAEWIAAVLRVGAACVDRQVDGCPRAGDGEGDLEGVAVKGILHVLRAGGQHDGHAAAPVVLRREVRVPVSRGLRQGRAGEEGSQAHGREPARDSHEHFLLVDGVV